MTRRVLDSGIKLALARRTSSYEPLAHGFGFVMMVAMRIAMATVLLLIAAPAAGEPTLVGFAKLPPVTFREGPTSGQFIDAANGITPPFENRQPVQGISSMIASPVDGQFLALSDNGFGSKANSADYVLCVYSITPDWESHSVEWDVAFELSDPDSHVPWPIVAEGATYPNSDIPVPAAIKDKRLLTGADFDVESMVRLPDGTFWLGDEFGPFLLHVDGEGKLLEPPVELPGEGMHSPDHPTKDPATAKVQRSGGFEGMAIVTLPTFEGEPPSVSIFPMLEKPLSDGWQPVFLFLRSPALPEVQWVDLERDFPMCSGSSAIGEFTFIDPSSSSAGIVIERDSAQGDEAQVKQLSLYFLPLADLRADPVMEKAHEETRDIDAEITIPLADLLNIADPDDLDGDGSTVYSMPFWTIESVWPIDDRTVLVCNDNNYPFSSARGQGKPEDTEFALIRFDRPLSELAQDAQRGN